MIHTHDRIRILSQPCHSRTGKPEKIHFFNFRSTVFKISLTLRHEKRKFLVKTPTFYLAPEPSNTLQKVRDLRSFTQILAFQRLITQLRSKIEGWGFHQKFSFFMPKCHTNFEDCTSKTKKVDFFMFLSLRRGDAGSRPGPLRVDGAR
jgi:hypothetical protein